jgi:hypothetical protein
MKSTHSTAGIKKKPSNVVDGVSGVSLRDWPEKAYPTPGIVGADGHLREVMSNSFHSLSPKAIETTC